MISDMEHLFMCLLAICIYSVEKMSIQVFSLFFSIRLFVFLILSCMSCLYIVDINSLSVILFANFFSHSVCCLLVLLMVFFNVKKLLWLIGSLFAFISFALEDRSKKYCYNLCQRVFHLCFLTGILWFQVLHLGL